MRIIDFLFGKITLAFDQPSDHKAVFEILRRSGANYQNIHLKEQTLILVCPFKDGKCLCQIFSQKQISYRIVK